MIFYEAPHKLTGTLEDLEQAFGPERRICLCRELTKLHEEAMNLTLEEAVQYYQTASPRGEYVLILEGARPRAVETPDLPDCLEAVSALRQEGLSLKDAVKRVSQQTGVSKNILYDAALRESI